MSCEAGRAWLRKAMRKNDETMKNNNQWIKEICLFVGGYWQLYGLRETNRE